jgi:hypothetical protein
MVPGGGVAGLDLRPSDSRKWENLDDNQNSSFKDSRADKNYCRQPVKQ